MNSAQVFTPVLRRSCACGGTPGHTGECEACRKKRQGLQRSASTAAPAVAPPVVHDVLRSPGTPLDGSVRAQMEPRFRHSFADVRVHADSRAAESARSVGAHAYAVGPHVVFGAGRYAPGSVDGSRLIAHELAHVVQQRGASASIQPKLEIGAADDPAEREADTAAARVVSGADARVAQAPALLRRVANPGPPPPGLTCTPGASSPPVPVVDLVFPRGVSALDAGQQARVDAFVVSWNATAGMDDVRVDGYASEEASGEFNWRLSCDR
ncbi:MAG TPA: DUF4157 domain-containing protein, partial [Longimicrobium sp.]|nr:DUF4157 domain-containing protein [Longimicrobium sp.]